LHDAGADAVILRTLPHDSDHDRFLAGVAEVARLTA
jgi:hypothetical protein